MSLDVSALVAAKKTPHRQNTPDTLQFPADENFWKCLQRLVTIIPGAQDKPTFDIEGNNKDEVITVNRAFLTLFRTAWAAEFPLWVTVVMNESGELKRSVFSAHAAVWYEILLRSSGYAALDHSKQRIPVGKCLCHSSADDPEQAAISLTVDDWHAICKLWPEQFPNPEDKKPSPKRTGNALRSIMQDRNAPVVLPFHPKPQQQPPPPQQPLLPGYSDHEGFEKVEKLQHAVHTPSVSPMNSAVQNNPTQTRGLQDISVRRDHTHALSVSTVSEESLPRQYHNPHLRHSARPQPEQRRQRIQPGSEELPFPVHHLGAPPPEETPPIVEEEMIDELQGYPQSEDSFGYIEEDLVETLAPFGSPTGVIPGYAAEPMYAPEPEEEPPTPPPVSVMAGASGRPRGVHSVVLDAPPAPASAQRVDETLHARVLHVEANMIKAELEEQHRILHRQNNDKISRLEGEFLRLEEEQKRQKLDRSYQPSPTKKKSKKKKRRYQYDATADSHMPHNAYEGDQAFPSQPRFSAPIPSTIHLSGDAVWDEGMQRGVGTSRPVLSNIDTESLPVHITAPSPYEALHKTYSSADNEANFFFEKTPAGSIPHQTPAGGSQDLRNFASHIKGFLEGDRSSANPIGSTVHSSVHRATLNFDDEASKGRSGSVVIDPERLLSDLDAGVGRSVSGGSGKGGVATLDIQSSTGLRASIKIPESIVNEILKVAAAQQAAPDDEYAAADEWRSPEQKKPSPTTATTTPYNTQQRRVSSLCDSLPPFCEDDVQSTSYPQSAIPQSAPRAAAPLPRQSQRAIARPLPPLPGPVNQGADPAQPRVQCPNFGTQIQQQLQRGSPQPGYGLSTPAAQSGHGHSHGHTHGHTHVHTPRETQTRGVSPTRAIACASPLPQQRTPWQPSPQRGEEDFPNQISICSSDAGHIIVKGGGEERHYDLNTGTSHVIAQTPLPPRVFAPRDVNVNMGQRSVWKGANGGGATPAPSGPSTQTGLAAVYPSTQFGGTDTTSLPSVHMSALSSDVHVSQGRHEMAQEFAKKQFGIETGASAVPSRSSSGRQHPWQVFANELEKAYS